MSEPKMAEGARDVAQLLGDIERLQEVVAGWTPEQQAAVAAYRASIDALNAEAFRRLIRSLKTDPVAFAALKDAVADDLVYAVLRKHELIKPSVQERVEDALRSVRPMLASHGGDVELVRVTPPNRIEVRFTGSCDSCPASALTFHAGVKKAIQDHCPEITEIVQVKGLAASSGGRSVRFVSPFAHAEAGEWLVAGDLDAIPETGALFTRVGGQPVMLARAGHGIVCYQNACAHRGGGLEDGVVADGVIVCPRHGFRYDLESGVCLTAPEAQLAAHAVRVVGSRVDIRLAT